MQYIHHSAIHFLGTNLNVDHMIVQLKKKQTIDDVTTTPSSSKITSGTI